MTFLTLTAVLVVAGLAAACCLVVAAAVVAWLVRDARVSRDRGEAVWTTAAVGHDRAPGGAA